MTKKELNKAISLFVKEKSPENVASYSKMTDEQLKKAVKQQKIVVNFDTEGGKKVKSVRIDKGDSITLTYPQRKGYVFVGWFEDSIKTIPFTGKIIQESLTVYAKWTTGLTDSQIEKYYKALRKPLAKRCALNPEYIISKRKTFAIIEKGLGAVNVYLPIDPSDLRKEGYDVLQAPDKNAYKQTPSLFVVKSHTEFLIAQKLVERVVNGFMLADVKKPGKIQRDEISCELALVSGDKPQSLTTTTRTTLKQSMGMRRKNKISNTIVYIVLIAMTVIWLFPFCGILLNSLEVASRGISGHIIPQKWGFDNYKALFEITNFKKWYINTSIAGICTAVLQTAIVLLMSYTLSRLRFKGRKLLMNAMLVLGMFPGFLAMIVLYKVLSWFNMTGPHAVPGLILVYCASSGMGYYVSKGFFDTIPRSLDEAARVDGATRFQVFCKVIMPLAKPIVIYTILMGFMAPWGDFMFAKYIVHASSEGMNVAVGMQLMLEKTNIGTQYTLFCAAGVLVAVPVTLLFMFLQRYYVEGVTGGAVKG